jgi:ceramide glucosyltransferase
MRAGLRGIVEKIALGATVVSLCYTGFAIARLRAFERRVRERRQAAHSADAVAEHAAADTAVRAAGDSERPAVSVLKPVHGLEPGLDANLRSFCAQDYPAYDVVFGVHRADDPALEVIRAVAAAFPDRTTVAVGDGVARYRNPKIANLAGMLAHARGEILVIADSDMRVTPDYLDAVVAPFADPRVAAVTAVYRGEPADGTPASVLGAMWITEQFVPSALVAAALEPLAHTFGATMAVRRTVFDAIGGLDALGDRLADDHALGMLVAEHGYTVALAAYTVENAVAERDLRALLEHELRWARTIRSVRPASYPGIALTYPVPLALLHLAVASRKKPALGLAAAALVLRFVVRGAARRALGARTRGGARLVPLRDALGIGVWAIGLFGRGVRWRDAALDITRSGGIAAPPESR